jgi:PQQ system protein
VNYLPRVDRPNEVMVGRLFAQGGLSHVRPGTDGVMRDRVRVRHRSLVWEPSVLVMPHPGTLEVEVANEDEVVHIGYFPDGAADRVLVLPARTAGRVRVTLDAPGIYTFADGVADNSGRGMLGIIIVEGESPAEARLDRPRQPRP